MHSCGSRRGAVGDRLELALAKLILADLATRLEGVDRMQLARVVVEGGKGLAASIAEVMNRREGR